MLPELDDLYHRCEPDPPSTVELQQTFLLALRFVCLVGTGLSLSEGLGKDIGHTYIVLDGLDEVQYGPKRNAILKLLGEISTLELPRLHMLVSSRQEVDIEASLKSLPRWQPLKISQHDVELDLKIFVTNQISENQKLRDQSKPVKDEITQKLVGGANGMYVSILFLTHEIGLKAFQVPVDCATDAGVEQETIASTTWYQGCSVLSAKGYPRNI
jgi:hypothetical protein